MPDDAFTRAHAALIDGSPEALLAASDDLRAIRDALTVLVAREDKAMVTKRRRFQDGVRKVRDRRRFPIGQPADGQANITVPADTAGTIFPSRVLAPTQIDRVLKDGAMNSKIGGDVLKGRLKGARIYTLTLEERATCPRSCKEWTTCYGNSLNWSTRWKHGTDLEARIVAEVDEICADGKPVLIRLHILGDFYSLDYCLIWEKLLQAHDNLNVFGFTAWPRQSKIGRLICGVRDRFGERFSIRHSGQTGEWGSFVIDFPTEQARLGDAVVCPEQREANAGKQGRHCGNCTLCWQSDVPIIFVRH